MERELCLSPSIGLGTQEGTCPGHTGCQEPEIRVYRSYIPAGSSSKHTVWTYFLQYFPGGSVVKHLSANARDMGSILESGRSPREGNSSILAWKIPWTEEPGGLQSMGLQRVRHDWTCTNAHARYTISGAFCIGLGWSFWEEVILTISCSFGWGCEGKEERQKGCAWCYVMLRLCI